MKRKTLRDFVGLLLLILFSGAVQSQQEQYVVITWNDLGMHCSNKDFSKLAILPPYNNLTAHVIKRGSPGVLPEVVTAGIEVNYSVPGNTYSVGKTNFWSYEDALFGVSLPDNVGLTGATLSGYMEAAQNAFTVEGVPLTPYQDNNLITEDPYQLALVEAHDAQGNLLATTQNVIPVSNEINCVSSGCHSSEMNILYEHEEEGGFNPNNTPILCASCHGSNALGLPGNPELGSLSEVIHDQHKEITNDCYKCHPGPNTHCQRGAMYAAGMVCQDCHGSVSQVAQSIKNGRQPWLEEPKCGAVECHGPQYAEEPGKLFRQSKGHGGLYCSTCHGSPHALVPSTLDRDNLQNETLQGYAGVLNNCAVCHGYMPAGPGPHGLYAPATTQQTIALEQGWNSLSSYLVPLLPDFENVIGPVAANVVIASDGQSVYYPAEGINTLSRLDANKGYMIKMSAAANLDITGIVDADPQLTLPAGWTIMPVLSACQVPVADFVASNAGQILMIKEVAGYHLYWPGKNVGTLDVLLPGKAYYILTGSEINITFPACN